MRGKPQANFCSSPQDVVGGPRPFFPDEEINLRLIKVGAEPSSERRHGVRFSEKVLGPCAVETDVSAQLGQGQPAETLSQPRRIGFEAAGPNVATGQDLAPRVSVAGPRHDLAELSHRVLGEPTMGRELAAEHGEDRRQFPVSVNLEGVVASQCRQSAVATRADLEQRPDTGEAPYDVRAPDRCPEEAVHLAQHVVDLRIGNDHVLGPVGPRLVGGADDGEIVFIRKALHQAAVAGLHEVGVFLGPQPRHDEVTAAHHAQLTGGLPGGHLAADIDHPRTAGVDERFRSDGARLACVVFECDRPAAGRALRIEESMAREHAGAVPLSSKQVCDDESRIVAAAVRIDEGIAKFRLERAARGMLVQVDGSGARQRLPPVQVIVQEEPQPDHPDRPLALHVRENEPQR